MSKRSARQAAAVIGLQDSTAGTFALFLCAEAADRPNEDDQVCDAVSVVAVVAAQLLGERNSPGKGKKKGGTKRGGKDRGTGKAAAPPHAGLHEVDMLLDVLRSHNRPTTGGASCAGGRRAGGRKR